MGYMTYILNNNEGAVDTAHGVILQLWHNRVR